ncbi:hypothetical protein DL96DRAFT_1581056, partial [Flagelloscypha sp. PMI_526]
FGSTLLSLRAFVIHFSCAVLGYRHFIFLWHSAVVNWPRRVRLLLEECPTNICQDIHVRRRGHRLVRTQSPHECDKYTSAPKRKSWSTFL